MASAISRNGVVSPRATKRTSTSATIAAAIPLTLGQSPRMRSTNQKTKTVMPTAPTISAESLILIDGSGSSGRSGMCLTPCTASSSAYPTPWTVRIRSLPSFWRTARTCESTARPPEATS